MIYISTHLYLLSSEIYKTVSSINQEFHCNSVIFWRQKYSTLEGETFYSFFLACYCLRFFCYYLFVSVTFCLLLINYCSLRVIFLSLPFIFNLLLVTVCFFSLFFASCSLMFLQQFSLSKKPNYYFHFF